MPTQGDKAFLGLSAGEIVENYYRDSYAQVHSSGSLGRASATFHRALERPRDPEDYPVTLELGAGALEHLPFVQHTYSTYIASDIRQISPVAERQIENAVKIRQLDAEDLELPSQSVDRVVATCLVVHLNDPWKALVEWQRVCRTTGVIDFLVPCDPGLTSRAFRRLISERAAGRIGVTSGEYRLVNALEHVSSFARILALAKTCTMPGRRLDVEYYPFRWVPSWNVNAFAIFRINPA